MDSDAEQFIFSVLMATAALSFSTHQKVETMTTNLEALKTEIEALKAQVAANITNEDVLFAAVKTLKDQLTALQVAGGASEADLQALIDSVVPLTEALTGAAARDALPADAPAPAPAPGGPTG